MCETTTITIIIEPVGTGMFLARLGCRLLCTSHEPLLAAARVLNAEGVGPGTTIAMQHMDSTVIALRAKIGMAAKTTVEDGRDGVPRFRRWKAPPSVGPTPPMRFAGSQNVAEAGSDLGAPRGPPPG